MKELIETLWNVNTTQRVEISKSLAELIETLWNVNEEPEPEQKPKKKN